MKIRATIVLMFAACLFAVSVNNAGAVRLGPVDVHPYLEFKTVYDDNVFVLPDGQFMLDAKGKRVDRSDWYFLASPGMLVQMGNETNAVEGEFRSDVYRYANTGKANDVEDYYLRLAGVFNKTGRLSVTASDLGSRAHESRSSSNQAISGDELNKYYANDLNLQMKYVINRSFDAAIDYKNYTIDYDLGESKYRDRMDNGVGLTLFYKYSPKTSILLEGIYKNVEHTNTTHRFTTAAPITDISNKGNLDSKEYWLMTGLTWNITSKSIGTAKIGYEWKDFKAKGRSNFGSPIYQVSLAHKFTSKITMKVTGTRQANETDDPAVPYYTSTGAAAEISYFPLRKIEVKPYISDSYSMYAGKSR